MNRPAPAPLIVVAGGDVRTMIDFVFPVVSASLQRATAEPVVIAVGSTALVRDRDGPPTLIAEHLRPNRRVRILAPPRFALATRIGSGRTAEAWTAVDLSGRSDRLDRVWLPHALAGANDIVLVNSVGPRPGHRQPIAIGVWSLFARPLQRISARFDDPRYGLAAEIALAVSARLIILGGRIASRPVLIATTDVVVAELAGISLSRLGDDSAAEISGAWEDPLVQRATELGLGVRLPAEILLLPTWLGEPDSDAEASFLSVCRRLRSDLGLTAET